MDKYQPDADSFTPKRRSKWVTVGLPLLGLAIVAAVVGGVVGSRAAANHAVNVSAAAAASGGSPSSSSSSSAAGGTSAGTAGGTSAKATGGSSTASAGTAVVTPAVAPGTFAVVDLPVWDWGKDKAVGMCLGNWLSLERWMNEDWFVANAGNSSEDEFTFWKTLGVAAATPILTEHYNTWITEADVELMYQQGINHLRIPTGFWAWIPTVAGEPYANIGQVAQVERILGYAYKRGMYALIDLHGLPGSQNGEESSGHLTESPAWFGNTVNQGRSDATVAAVLAWLETNPYRSVVSGIEVINEPRPYTSAQNQELSDFYARSYTQIQASAWPVAMFLHPGFIADGFNYWKPFAAARVTNPPSLVIEDHPYPGNFPAQFNTADMLSQVCTAAQKYLSYPIPVAITEWSVYTGVKTQAFEKSFYESQLVSWAWSAGGMYWSYKHIPSKMQLAQGLDYSQYSFLTLVNNATDTIPAPADFGLTNTTTRANAALYLAALSGNCGAVPSNASPSNAAAVPVWSAQAAARSKAAGQTLRATATPARRHKRSKRGHN